MSWCRLTFQKEEKKPKEKRIFLPDFFSFNFCGTLFTLFIFFRHMSPIYCVEKKIFYTINCKQLRLLRHNQKVIINFTLRIFSNVGSVQNSYKLPLVKGIQTTPNHPQCTHVFIWGGS